MPIDKLVGFRFPGTQASVFDEEQMTALQLAGRTAQKTNEVIDMVNTFEPAVAGAPAATAAANAAATAANAAAAAADAATDSANVTIGMLQPFSAGKLVCLGDSITYGSYATVPFPQLVKTLCNFSELVNLSVPGVTAADDAGTILSQIASIPADAAAICVMIGTNDFYPKQKALGRFVSGDDDTFCGGITSLIQQIQTAHPTAKLFFVTPPARSDISYMTANSQGLYFKDYIRMLREHCALFSVPVIDIFNSGINPVNTAIKDAFMPDGVHPNNAGHAVLAQIISHYINSGFGNNSRRNFPQWSAFALKNSWVQHTGATCQYLIDDSGVVHLRGSVKNGATSILATLPTQIFPDNTVVCQAVDPATGLPVGVVVAATGDVVAFGYNAVNGINFNASYIPKAID